MSLTATHPYADNDLLDFLSDRYRSCMRNPRPRARASASIRSPGSRQFLLRIPYDACSALEMVSAKSARKKRAVPAVPEASTWLLAGKIVADRSGE